MEGLLKSFGKLLLTLYNLIEFVGWTVLAFMLVRSFTANPEAVFRDIRVPAPEIVQLYVYLQVF